MKSIVPLASASLTGEGMLCRRAAPLQGPRGFGLRRRQVRRREGGQRGRGVRGKRWKRVAAACKVLEHREDGGATQWNPTTMASSQGGGDLPATCPQTWLHLKEPFDKQARTANVVGACLAESSPANKVLANFIFIRFETEA